MPGVHASELYTGPSYKFRGAIPFIWFPGDGLAVGLKFTSTSGDFVLSAAVTSGVTYAKSFGYFAANQINGANAAGWYYVEMSSTTVGKVWNNRYLSGHPAKSIPDTAARVPFTTTLDFWITATINVDIAGPVVAVPGNCLGMNGGGHVEAVWSMTSSANTKTMNINYGGTSLAGQNATTVVNQRQLASIGMRGAYDSYVTSNWLGATSSTTNALAQRMVDTRQTQSLAYSGRITANSDLIVLEYYSCILYMED